MRFGVGSFICSPFKSVRKQEQILPETESWRHLLGIPLGIGGRTVDKLKQFGLAKLHVLQPNVVVLEIGSNDLCDISSDPETVGSTIITLIDRLRVEFSVDWVVVCQTLPRKNQSYPEYNSAVSSLNSWLKIHYRYQQKSMLHFGDTVGLHVLRSTSSMWMEFI